MPQTNITLAKRRAKALGYTVEASSRKHKKLDVYKNGKRIAAIGDTRYEDYLTHGDEKRRRLYHARHKGPYPVSSPGWLAKKILW